MSEQKLLGLAICAGGLAKCFLFPEFGGIFFESLQTSIAQGRVIGVLIILIGLLMYFYPFGRK